MTEKQWLKSTDPRPMLERLGRVASDRQLRLFACACARRVWHLLADERSRTAVEVAEQFADELVGEDELVRACTAAWLTRREFEEEGSWAGADWAARVAFLTAQPSQAFRSPAGSSRSLTTVVEEAVAAAETALPPDSDKQVRTRKEERKALANIMRDLFGNPFRSVRFLPVWRTDTVTARQATLRGARLWLTARSRGCTSRRRL